MVCRLPAGFNLRVYRYVAHPEIKISWQGIQVETIYGVSLASSF